MPVKVRQTNFLHPSLSSNQSKSTIRMAFSQRKRKTYQNGELLHFPRLCMFIVLLSSFFFFCLVYVIARECVCTYVQTQTTTVYVIDHLFFKSVCKEQQKERN